MQETLLIVDMQPEFSATADDKRTIRNIKREIINAKRRKDTIVLLEYVGCGQTFREIIWYIGQYPYIKFRKYNDDGSNVARMLRRKKLPHAHFRVCGVNTSYCVFETVNSLAHKNSTKTIKLVLNACNCARGRRALLPQHKKISVVK